MHRTRFLTTKCIKKQRHYFANKSLYNQSYGFTSSHVWMWELIYKEGWALKNWWFWIELCCWKRLLRVPWTTRISNLSILKQINPEYSLEGLLLKLKLQSFGHLMRRANSLENTLMLGKIESKRRRGWQRMKWLDSISEWMDMNLSMGTPGNSGKQRSLACYSLWECRVRYDLVTEQQQRQSQVLGKNSKKKGFRWCRWNTKKTP